MMRFRVLGPVEVEARGEVLALPRRRARRLLAILLLDLNRVVSSSQLADLLWDGDPSESARRTIHSHVSRVRAVLAQAEDPEIELATVGDGYRMRADPAVVDAHWFRAMLERAADEDLPARVALLRSALDLWRGPPLQDVAGDRLRERLCAGLEELRLRAAEDFFGGSLALGREREILPELAATAAAHPGRERLAEQHMRALHRSGRRADALAVYARIRGYLIGELGLDPGPALRDLHQAILRDEPSSAVLAAPAGEQAVTVPRQLPADIATFTGRTAELRAMDALLPADPPGPAPSGVVILGLEGTAGVGKTALALHWAHRVSGRFPDGQLYANLRGFDGSAPPASASEVVRTFLDALGVAARDRPASLEARVGLYRSLLSGRRMLIVLDNARDCAQVRPLLPGSSSCVAVVTSRHQIKGLVAVEGARQLTVGPLSRADARHLLVRRLGRDRVAAEPDAVEEVLTACAMLPLALAIVAARAAAYPSFPLGALAGELDDGDGVPAVLTTPDAAVDLREVFAWSYQTLAGDAASLFARLGSVPAADLSVADAAGLTGAATAVVRSQLAELVRAHLIIEHAPGRFTFPHHLLRAYAGELGRTRWATGRRDR